MDNSNTTSVFSNFVQTPLREKSGARSSNRFAYQTSWAFCLLLKLYKNKTDFLLVLDFHEDVVVLDSETTPALIDFFQVKTKTGRAIYSLKDLLRISKKQKLSILGKLYDNKVKFQKAAKSLNFISNAQYQCSTKKAPDKKDQLLKDVPINDLCANSLSMVIDSLKKEHQLDFLDSNEININLQTDSLSVDDHINHATGCFTQFITELEQEKYPVSHTFKSIMSELQKRSSYEGAISSIDDLRLKKGMGRAEFHQLIERMKESESTAFWNLVSLELSNRGPGVVALQNIKREYESAQLAKIDFADSSTQHARAIITQEIDLSKRIAPLTPLYPFLQNCCQSVKDKLAVIEVPFNDNQIIGIILSILSENK